MTFAFSDSGGGLVKVAGILPRRVLAGDTTWQAKVTETDCPQKMFKRFQEYIPRLCFDPLLR